MDITINEALMLKELKFKMEMIALSESIRLS